MQYKKNIKIVIDKRKLDLLIRLNCPKDVIYDAVVNNTITKVGDELIDDTLEALIDVKEFNNWGGKREGSGRKNHLENQVENHLENQELNQVVDKDKDIDKELEKDNTTKIDYYNNPIINKIFEIYNTHCGNLVKLDKFYRRNVELKKQVGIYLEQTESDLEYFTRVCEIANDIKKVGDVNIDLKMILKHHDGFYNGKYKTQEPVNKALQMLF